MQAKVMAALEEHSDELLTNVEIADALGFQPDKTLVALAALVESEKVVVNLSKDGPMVIKKYGLKNGEVKMAKNEDPLKGLNKTELSEFITEGGGEAKKSWSKGKLVDIAEALIEAAKDPPEPEPEPEKETPVDVLHSMNKEGLLDFIKEQGGYGTLRMSKMALCTVAEELLQKPAIRPEPTPMIEATPEPGKPFSKMKKAELVAYLVEWQTKYSFEELKELNVKMLRSLAKDLPGTPVPTEEEATPPDFSTFTKAELAKAAGELGIKFSKSWSKTRILEAILSPEPEPEPEKPKVKKVKAPKVKKAKKAEPVKAKLNGKEYTFAREPKSYLPKECKACGEEATTLKKIDSLFGWRTPTGKPTIPQSQCKECRKISARASAEKAKIKAGRIAKKKGKKSKKSKKGKK